MADLTPPGRRSGPAMQPAESGSAERLSSLSGKRIPVRASTGRPSRSAVSKWSTMSICTPDQDAERRGELDDALRSVRASLHPASTPALRRSRTGRSIHVRVCTHEFGFAGASTCTVKTLQGRQRLRRVPPEDLAVAGGRGLASRQRFRSVLDESRRSNHAPIAVRDSEGHGPGRLRVHRSPGPERTSRRSTTSESRRSAHIQRMCSSAMRRAIESPQASAAVSLRFDDTVPAKSQPENANGWISRGRAGRLGTRSMAKASATLNIPLPDCRLPRCR